MGKQQARSGAGGGGGQGTWSPRPRGPGRPSKHAQRSAWHVSSLVRLVSALEASEGARAHAKSLAALLTWAAGQGEGAY